MARQNRVTPSGELIRTPSRGMFMGNRGNLHDEHGEIRRQWKVKAWITCLLEFRGIKRQIFSPGSLSELFFLDEATAFAAGHRPCAECRYRDYKKFKNLWIEANRDILTTDNPSIKEVDRIIHEQRITRQDKKVVFEGKLKEVPNGVFVQLKNGKGYHLVRDHYLYEWSPSGYVSKMPKKGNADVWILTPLSLVKTIKSGYSVIIHPSVDDI